MYRHVLVYREHAAAFFGYAGEQGAEDARLMVEQHREHGLAPAVKLRRLKDIVLVFIIRAARDASQLHRVAHVLFLPVFKHTPHGEHFFIIVGKYILMYKKIIFKHDHILLYFSVYI